MADGVLRRLRFVLEMWVQRGVLAQLLLMTALVALVAVLGGVAAWVITPAFESLPTAVWWSFLRLTDPGYLGDDEGIALRMVSTVVTVLGYVLFMGSLIAIMTQWLTRTVRNLESGLTPISMENHFVILGWTNRTPEIIQKLLTAGGRLDRLLARRGGSSRLRIVVLADEVNAERRQELRDHLGADWQKGRIFLRSGSSLKHEQLARLDLLRAAVVMIPGADFELGGAELTDTRVIKTLLTLDLLFRQDPDATTPYVVAELFDPRKVSIARSSIGAKTEVIAGDRLISRLLSQSLRQPGVAKVLLGLLKHREGNTLYLRAFPELAGASLRDLVQTFSQAVVLGAVKLENDGPIVHLDPTRDVVLGERDLLILLAERYDRCLPEATSGAKLPPLGTPRLPPKARSARHRLLILGWSFKIRTLLEELLESSVERFEVTILSRVGNEERERFLGRLYGSDRLSVENIEGDYSLEHDLAPVEPEGFDHILFLASGWMHSSEEADARTVLGVLLLRSLLRGRTVVPEILVELLDPDNARILGAAADLVFVSPRMLSHLLAHVGLRPELNAVFDELICAGGVGIELHPIEALGLGGDGVSFGEVQLAAARLGCVGLGFLAAQDTAATQEVHLNPERDRRWSLEEGDRVVLLSSESKQSADS